MLTVEGLSFGFPGRQILDNISIQLQPGAVTCLLGGNGSGKTTLFNVIGGFLRPAAGTIRLGKAEITKRAPFRISRLGIARTFQDLRLIEKLSVRENILLSLSSQPDERLARALFHPASNPERSNEHRDKTDILLKEFFLEDVADQLASDVSYGQQKLLTLSCCAGMDANLLLLDEPVAGISPEYREYIADRIEALRAAGKTILLIEHQPDFLERVGERFLFLESGRLHAFDTLGALRAAPVACEVLN
jgi:ABC-type branched-subunit amino acid transport system ATPase component